MIGIDVAVPATQVRVKRGDYATRMDNVLYIKPVRELSGDSWQVTDGYDIVQINLIPEIRGVLVLMGLVTDAICSIHGYKFKRIEKTYE